MKNDLIIPIYVDTNFLLDLLASIEGGFSMMEKITTQSTSAKNIDRTVSAEAGTEFGIPNVLNLLKINLGYGANWKKSNEEQQATETEKYHTYGSLLYRLIDYLETNSLIKEVGTDEIVWKGLKSSDFVIVRGFFQPNPLAHSLKTIEKLLEIFDLFIEPQKKGTARRKQTTSQPKLEGNVSSLQLGQIRKLLLGISDDIEKENVRTFILKMQDNPNMTFVSLLFLENLRDRTMAELSHKEYKLLGKIVRKVEAETNDSIDLLLGSAIGGVGDEVLQPIIDALNQIPQMKLPNVDTKIFGPALEIIPIAIFI